MADEQVIKLLEEIRDLQKLHEENYKIALQHQQAAIDFQKTALRRQRVVQIAAGIVVLVGVLILAWATFR